MPECDRRTDGQAGGHKSHIGINTTMAHCRARTFAKCKGKGKGAYT